MSASLLLTLVFAAAVAAGLLVRLWLVSRQIRHVAAHRDSVPAAYAQTIPLAAHQKAADYTLTKSRLGMLAAAVSAAILLGWTLLGGLDLLNQSLLAWLGGGMVQQLALFVAFMLVGGLLDLPLSLYSTFVVEARFGFNKMSWRLWLSDLIKGTLVGAALGLPLLAAVLWLMQAGGAMWWLYAWALLVVYTLFVQWIAPTFILPLFNKFTPLEDEALEARVSALMQRCGFTARGFFVMDGSRRSAHSNAFFTGFGRHKRVVFFDTLLAQLSHDEMEAVLAHELGHFSHRHILKRMALSFSLSLVALAVLGWLSTQAWFYTGLGVQPNVSAPNNALALLLFLLAVPVFSFFVSPLASQLSRRHEFEADAYAVGLTGTRHLGAALLKLYQDNASTLTPDPLFVKFHYSHPPASERLARMTA
ncbi:MAG: M48 family metallopeptidase [Ramlibacter sp.]|jgi:STE24 endopeptidase|nr:M48 family metallopeptidase [Ramlibacter sp.]